DIPANRLWIEDGKNGFLVPIDRWRRARARDFQAPPADGTALADQILAALSDETLRRRARAINSEIVRQKACWHSTMARMECAYRALIDRRLSQPRAVRDERG